MSKFFVCLCFIAVSACGERPEESARERALKELPVCMAVKPEVRCRIGKKVFPHGLPAPAEEEPVPPEELWRGTNPDITEI